MWDTPPDAGGRRWLRARSRRHRPVRARIGRWRRSTTTRSRWLEPWWQEPGPVQVRRHTFAEAQAEASRVLGALRARGYEVQEGLGLWQSSVRGEVPAGQSRAAGREELARVAIDDIGILDCDGRCQAEIDLGAGPGAADGGGPSPRP